MGLRLRPEFELLNSQYLQFYYNINVDQEFLKKVQGNIELCEHIVKADLEKSIIVRTVYWWQKRAEPFGMMMNSKIAPGLTMTTGQMIVEFDREFLRSLDIATEDKKEGA